jgi:hypothetical protein
MIYKEFYIRQHYGKDNKKSTEQFDPELYYETNIEKCQHKYMAIPIGFQEIKFGHANMLIIHKDKNTIKVEHFEPHGDFYSLDPEKNKKINKYIDHLVYSLFVRNGYTKNRIEIIHPEQLCNLNKSFRHQLQQLLAGTNFSDTCAIFSMWYSFYRLLYPALSSDEVYRQMNNRLERSKNRTETIKMIIQTFLSLIKINIDDYTISGERTINPRAQHSIKIIKDTVDNITTFVTGDLKTMKKMLKFEMIANVDVQDKTSNNYTALMYKLLLGNITEIIWLLEKGANVDIQDRDGKSAIFFAIHNDDVFMVKHLLKYNPNLNIEDKSGHTPLTYAKMTKRKKIIPILEEAIKE